MQNSMNVNKNYKCSIENCSNSVQYKGSFCSNCIDKIYHNQFYVEICGFCENVYKIFTTENSKNDDEELFIYVACEKCKKHIMDQLQDTTNRNNNDDNDDDSDESDDWLNELDKFF